MRTKPLGRLRFRPTGWLAPATLMAAVGCGRAAPPTPVVEPEPVRPVSLKGVSGQYLVSTHRKVVRETSGRTDTSLVTYEFLLEVRLDSAGQGELGRVSLTLDSVLSAEGGGLRIARARTAQGSTFSGVLLPNGRIIDFAVPQRDHLFLQEISDQLSQLFPNIPEPGVLPGLEWRDTTSSETETSGGALVTVTARNTHEVTDWQDHLGFRSLRIDTESQIRLDGKGSQAGQDFTIVGQGISWASVFLSEAGRFLGGFSRDSVSGEATIPELGITIPIIQLGVDTVTVSR